MKIKSFIYEKNKKIDLDFIPNLAFLFFEGEEVSVIETCYRDLKIINKEMEIVGVNGANGNINNSIPFITDISQISILLFDVSDFKIQLFDADNLENLSCKYTKHYEYYKNSASILFFPFEYDTNKFLDYIQNDKNMHNIYGGVYSKYKNVGCFYNGKFYSNKLISVLFNQDKIEFFSKSLHGWNPIGVSFKVTKSDKNIVYELEDEPALRIIEEHIGKVKDENISKFLHPFCVNHNNDKSLASLKAINRKDDSMEFYKYIYEGEEITLTIPINQHKMMSLIERQLKDIECDALFMFSCVGRYAYYKDLLEFEIEKVADFLKVPFAGFLTFGEIGSNDIHTKSILQNQTMNLVFLKENR